jgi:hypothetical protein
VTLLSMAGFNVTVTIMMLTAYGSRGRLYLNHNNIGRANSVCAVLAEG